VVEDAGGGGKRSNGREIDAIDGDSGRSAIGVRDEHIGEWAGIGIGDVANGLPLEGRERQDADGIGGRDKVQSLEGSRQSRRNACDGVPDYLSGQGYAELG